MGNKKIEKKIGPLTQVEAEMEVKIDPTIELDNIDKKEFAAFCGIGKSALHHYSSSSWTETRMVIESILKDRSFDDRLLKIVKVKLFIDEIKTWLADSDNFFLPMRNKRIGLYKKYPENIFQLYGLENIQPNKRELSLFLPNEEDKKKSLEYSKAVQTKMSVFEEINKMIFEKTGIKANKDKLIEQAEKAQKIILKFGEEQKTRQSNLRKRLADDDSNRFYHRIDDAYLRVKGSKLTERLAGIVDAIWSSKPIDYAQKTVLTKYSQPENRA